VRGGEIWRLEGDRLGGIYYAGVDIIEKLCIRRIILVINIADITFTKDPM
jgi:hypothetical protein